MIKMSRIENTILMNSTIHNVAVGFIVVSFRKATPFTPEFWANVSLLKATAKRAKTLEASMPLVSSYAKMLQQAKKEVYEIRHAYSRSTSTVIHSIVEEAQEMTAGQAWDMLLNGQGTSLETGKQIKPITRLEKRRKVAVKFVQALADSFTK